METKSKPKTKKQTKKPAKKVELSETPVIDGMQANAEVDFPNVAPPSRSERNAPPTPTTLRVCGNTIPIINGKAAEADPKILRLRAMEAARRRGGRIDETRI